MAYNGSEPVHYKTIKKFYETFKVCGFKEEAFFPCYGLAESTLMVSGGKKKENSVILKLDTEAFNNNIIIENTIEFNLEFIIQVNCHGNIIENN